MTKLKHKYTRLQTFIFYFFQHQIQTFNFVSRIIPCFFHEIKLPLSVDTAQHNDDINKVKFSRNFLKRSKVSKGRKIEFQV